MTKNTTHKLLNPTKNFFAALLVFVTLCVGNVRGINYYSAANNAPNTTTNWWTNTNGTGSNPANFITAGNVFIIQNGHTMTTTNTWTVSGTGSTIQINTGGTLVASNAVTATVMTVASGGTYQHNQNGGTIPTATWNAGSTCSITGITNAASLTGLVQTFGNFTWNNTAQATGNFYLQSNITTAGDFTILSTGATNDPNNFSLRMSNTATGYTMTVGGNFVISNTAAYKMNNNTGGCTLNIAGNLTINNTSSFVIVTGGASSTVNVNGNVNIAGGTLGCNENDNTSVGALNVKGNFSFSGGNINTQTSGYPGAINFNGTTTQVYSKTGGTITNTVNFAVLSGSTLDVGTSIIDGSNGTFSLNSGAGIITAHASGISTTAATGSIQVTGTKTYNAGANYTFNANGAQNIGNVPTYNNLTLAGSAAKTLSGGVNGILSVEGTATTAGSITYGGAATLQYKGSASQTTGIEFPATFTSSGGVIINNTNGVILGAAKSISSKLTFVNGKLTTTGTNLLSITNTSTIAITGGTATSYVSGPLKWTLTPSMSAGSTYNFPVGSASTYLPFALVDPLTGTGVVTAQVEAFSANPGGGIDATLTAKSNTEYWQLTTSGNFTNSSVSIYRQTTITPTYDVVATSGTVNGAYTSIYGLTGTNGVSNSNSIGATNRFFAFGKGNPTIVLTPVTVLNDFTYPEGLGPSTQLRYFTVRGSSLTTNITILPSSSFEISLTSGVDFAAQSLITAYVFNGTVASTTIYVRMKAGLTLGAKGPENVACTSDFASTQNAACSGSVTTAAVITPTPTSLTNFTYNAGAGPSTAQSFSVSATNLSGNLTITGSTNYEIFTAATGTFVSSLIYTPAQMATAQTIWVRLKTNLTVGTYNESITLSTSNGVTKYVTCNGNVNSPTITLSNFVLGGFIYNNGSGPSEAQSFTVSGINLTANLVLTAPTSFEICQTVGGTYVTSLTLTQSGGTVSSTTIYTRLSSGLGTNTYGPSNLTATSTGAITQNVALTGKVVAAGAGILTSNTSLNGFVYTLGNGPSVVQSFTVSATSLTANLTATNASSNIEISLSSGSGFSNSLSITPSSGKVNGVIIYVRLKAGLSAQSYPSETIVLASTGATPVNVVCNGVVIIPVPTITAKANNTLVTYAACNNESVTLQSTATGINNQYWSGPNGFYSTSQNYALGNVTATNAGTYTVTGSALSGVNLLTNGNFEAGNSGFGSSYGYAGTSSTALSAGGTGGGETQYTVVADPQSVHSGFTACVDHSNPGTMQMVINGATSNGIITWSQSVSVIPNTAYQFSYWVQSVVASNPAELQLYVNGQPAGSKYTADLATCSWKQFTYNTNSGSNSVLQLTLINFNILGGGNDFSIDDIDLQQVFPITSSVDLTVNPTLPVSVSIISSSNPVYSGGAVNFTATPINGGTSPSYQWKVNDVNVGTNSSNFTYTPVTGDVIKCVLTSNYPCTTGSPATSNQFTALSRTNFWVGTNSSDWGTASNWSGTFIPAPGNDVEYATSANNPGNPAIRTLILDQNRTIGNLVNNSDQGLEIPATRGLKVNYSISTNGDPNLITVKSSTTLANGSLIFNNPSSIPVYATVEMYSKASWNLTAAVNARYQWQYFGIPLESVVASPFFDGAYVRRWVESGTNISNHWLSLANEDVINPFYGYELCQAAAKTYYFQGKLVNSDFNSGQLSYTSEALNPGFGALFPGQHIFANPYTSAIDVTLLSFGLQTEKTVYLYNTGSYALWLSSGGQSYNGLTPSAGQYYAIPQNQSGFLGVQKQVPSMQTMLVKGLSNSVDATFGITYSNVAINNTNVQRSKKSDDDDSSNKVGIMIHVNGKFGADQTWLFREQNTTYRFDNGWDGSKMASTSLSPQLFSITEDGKYQVNSVPDINNITLGFQAGLDKEDTLTVTNLNLEKFYAGVYLVDMVENITIDITQTGTQYMFKAESTPNPVNRFKIITRPYEKNASDKESQVKIFSSQNTIYIHNFGDQNGECKVYNIAGHYLLKESFNANALTTISNKLKPGAYIAVVIANGEKVSKRLIVR